MTAWPHRRSRLAAWPRVLAMAAALAGATCTSSSPTKPPPTPEPPILTSPDSTLRSLELGLLERSANLYERALAESSAAVPVDFHASFDPQDVTAFELLTGFTPPTTWTSAEEMRFFSQWAEGLGPPAVTFFPDSSQQDERGVDTTVLHRRYRIYNATSLWAVGRADLTFRRLGTSGEWKLTFWADHRDSIPGTCGMRRLDSRLQ